MEKPIVTIQTHDGPFHGDCVFAVVVLLMLIKQASPETQINIVRSRDLDIQADFRVDVGFMYEPERGLFDHHQELGAGCRDYGNSEPYASFGLVWKEFGGAICGSERAAVLVDKHLVRHVDATDCGLPTGAGYSISSAIAAFNPPWNAEEADPSRLDAFMQACEFAQTLLEKEIIRAKSMASAIYRVRKQASRSRKRGLPDEIMLMDNFVPWRGVVTNEFPDVQFVVFPNTSNLWVVHAVPLTKGSFKNKKLLPASWAGLSDSSLDAETQVPGSVFCHRNRHMVVHSSQEGALMLASLALAAPQE